MGAVAKQWVSNLRFWRYLFEHERKYRPEVPLATRLDLWRRGFVAEASTLYDFDTHGMAMYLTERDRYAFGELNVAYDSLLTNKAAFHWMMPYFTDRIPLMLGMIVEEQAIVRTGEEAPGPPKEWLRRLVQEHGNVVVKPLHGSGGRGVRLLRSADDVEEAELNGALLVTTFVRQHAYAQRIFPDATNTIRVLVLRDDDGPFVAGAIHRFGTDASAPVDSWGRGGLSVGIDPETGTMLRGVHHPARHDGSLAWHDAHPWTGVEFAGEVIPKWKDVVRELLDLGERMAFLPCVGWDVVITDDGFTIVEGNSRPSVSIMQVHGPLLGHDRVRAFYETYLRRRR